jgi:lipopolysaccharide/colanic/teichoic acid biosynthesis glycosyltransferase
MKTFFKKILNWIGKLFELVLSISFIILIILFIVFLITTSIIGFNAINDKDYISYKSLYCEQNITLNTKNFKIWKEEQNILLLKENKKEICE